MTKKQNANIAIICSLFNKDLTDEMLNAALKEAEKQKLSVKYVLRPFGSYDIIFLLSECLKKKDVDGAAILGCIIKGKTSHDEVIAKTVALKALDLSIAHNKPVSLGIIGHNATFQDAKKRVNEYAIRAIQALAISLKEKQKLEEK